MLPLTYWKWSPGRRGILDPRTRTLITVLTADFDFDLPEDLIAQYPVEPRDHARLLVIHRQNDRIEHCRFTDLPAILDPRDILTLNRTKVVPARLTGHRRLTGGRWEGLFLRDLGNGTWEILSSTRGRLSPGEIIVVGQDLQLILQDKAESGTWIARPYVEGNSHETTTLGLLERYGQVPLPPYIRRGKGELADRSRYQTIFAEQPGSVAAPTAGLHFTESLFRDLAKKGIKRTYLTLHVGIGTFRPIKTFDITDHTMYPEWAELPAATVTELNSRRSDGGRIVAVGSTAARTLETAATSGILLPFAGQTDLFIRPGHVFHGLDALITNFHLPKSTLLVLVSAFAGVELIRAAYREAIRHRYRFFSYGDAMLIL